MKNITIVCHDHKKSGANMSLLNWLKDVDKEKYNITVVVPRYNQEFFLDLKKVGVYKIINAHYIVRFKKLYKRCLSEKIKDTLKMIMSILNPINLFILTKKIKKTGVDIIHTNSFSVTYGYLISKKLKVPHVWHIREFMEEDHQITHLNNKKISEYTKNSYAIYISDVIKNKFEFRYQFKRSYLIYNKIEYDNMYKKEKAFYSDNKCNIIIVGTLSKNKGHMDAIKLIEMNSNIGKYKMTLYIVGDGPYKKELIGYVKRKKIKNIDFLGHRNDVINLRKKMDIALMCSRNEALGRVTVEAQYYENLVIGANCGCTPYIIRNNKTGYLYEINNIDELYKIVEKAIVNKKETKKIIENAKKISLQKFNCDISKKILDIYKAVLDSE